MFSVKMIQSKWNIRVNNSSPLNPLRKRYVALFTIAFRILLLNIQFNSQHIETYNLN